MISIEDIMSISKSDLKEASRALSKDDVPQLVEWLSLKDDNVRYQAFLLLQSRSSFFEDVYPHWDSFLNKLKSDNSYQRSIGLMLIAENVKWDTQRKIVDIIDDFLKLLNDEKPITIRQCIQSLGKISSFQPGLNDRIASGLLSINLMAVKETMRKSILLDILNVLLVIRKDLKTDEIESFILSALSGEILDRKSKKQIEALL
ncbi:MAG: hypothetical protein VB055_07410 [Oscillospiraceae bacterium]|nr:hypothetical protein [Oscillospiraceae bacterium]